MVDFGDCATRCSCRQRVTQSTSHDLRRLHATTTRHTSTCHTEHDILPSRSTSYFHRVGAIAQETWERKSPSGIQEGRRSSSQTVFTDCDCKKRSKFETFAQFTSSQFSVFHGWGLSGIFFGRGVSPLTPMPAWPLILQRFVNTGMHSQRFHTGGCGVSV